MLVSVIIPCYNVEDCVAEAVASVAGQTYEKLEIICIDNNSTDNTWSILHQLKQQYAHLIIDKEMRPGANAARNKGLAQANGEWIQFLDADDVLVNNKIEHQVQIVKDCKEDIAFITAAYKKRFIDGREQVIDHLSEEMYLGPFIHQAGITSANLWATKWLKRVQGWDENLRSSQETELMFRLLLAGGKYLRDHQALTIVQERATGQISKSDPAPRWKRFVEVRLKYLDWLAVSNKLVLDKLGPRFHDFLLATLIHLAGYDRDAAVDYYRKLSAYRWRTANTFGINYYKNSLIKMLGFPFYLKLKSIFR